METALKCLKESGIFYLATSLNNEPHVRPFGAACKFNNKLYICTHGEKNVAKQMKANPKVEITGMLGEKWFRLTAEVVLDNNIEAKKAMLEDVPMLKNIYKAEEETFELYYFKNASGYISTLVAKEKEFKF